MEPVDTGVSGGLAIHGAAHDRVREKENFDFDWKFILNADDRANAGMQVSEAGWQDVQLPHDWSISQDFDPKLSGGNGHLPGGIGWYRKTFRVDKEDKGSVSPCCLTAYTAVATCM